MLGKLAGIHGVVLRPVAGCGAVFDVFEVVVYEGYKSELEAFLGCNLEAVNVGEYFLDMENNLPFGMPPTGFAPKSTCQPVGVLNDIGFEGRLGTDDARHQIVRVCPFVEWVFLHGIFLFEWVIYSRSIP